MSDTIKYYYYLLTDPNNLESNYTQACSGSGGVADTFYTTVSTIEINSILYDRDDNPVINLGSASGNQDGWFVLSDTGYTQSFAVSQDLIGKINGIQDCSALPTTTTTTIPGSKVYYQLRSNTYYTNYTDSCNNTTSSQGLLYTYGTIHSGSTLYYSGGNTIVQNLGGWVKLSDTGSTQFISIYQNPDGIVIYLQDCSTLPTTTTTTSIPGSTTTTTTTYAPGTIIISRSPSGLIQIGDSVTFTIVWPLIDCNSNSIEWYLDGNSVGTGNPLTLNFNISATHNMQVVINKYTTPSWQGGHFYGGKFQGNFAGGSFHYGNLNDCSYISDIPKSKKFTTKF